MIDNIYAYANNKEIYSNDAENVKKLYEKLNDSIKTIKDKVISYLLGLLVNDLERIYNQLV